MKGSIKFLLVLSVFFSIGCATDPNKISAQYVSPIQYRNFDCEQIALEMAHIERRTNELYRSLKNEANADKWQMGVGIVLFWPALFALEGGDGPEATEYARLKGEYEALRIVSIEKKCGINFRDDLSDVIKDSVNEEKDTKKANPKTGSKKSEI